ncbi:MAG: DMT family transporter, partial [Dongiaceae bacterium]
SCTPLFTIMLAHFLTPGERLTVGRLAGVLIGIIGVLVLLDPRSLFSVGSYPVREIAILAAAFSYALAGIYGRHLNWHPPIVVATGQVTCSAVIALPLALLFEQPWQVHPSLQAIGAILGLSLLCTAVAYAIFFHILAAAGASNLLLVTLLMPASALLLGAFILGERPGAAAYMGLAFIAAGLVTIDGRLGRRLATFLAGSSAPRA